MNSRVLGRAIHFVLFATLSLSSLAHAGPEFLIAPEICERLVQSGALLNQTDARLLRVFPAVQNGGLCGPTCAYNVIKILEAETGKRLLRDTDPVKLFQTFENFVGDRLSLADGMQATELREAIQNFFHEQSDYRYIEIDWFDSSAGITENRIKDPQSIKIILMGSRNPNLVGHFVILKDIDYRKKTLTIIDPNAPDESRALKYQKVAPSFETTPPRPPRIQLKGPIKELYFGEERTEIDAIIHIER